MKTFSNLIPLARHFESDPNVKIVKRSTDARWFYHRLIPYSISGFNPFENAVYINQFSNIAHWLDQKKPEIRNHNFKDRLVMEYLFLLHDYLHVWSYQWVQELIPKSVKRSFTKITEKNYEDIVFCHLLTEAVATIGLDYWYLSTITLNDVLNVGTKVKNLTTSYHVSNDKEFKLLNKKFESQSLSFFDDIVELYFSGWFPGFDSNDLKRSPLVYEWLEHELSYSRTQRIYSREWISSVSHQKINLSSKNLYGPVKIDEKWKKHIIKDIAQLLWKKVKLDQAHHSNFKIHFDYPKKVSEVDPRFRVMLSTKQVIKPEHFDFYFYQQLSHCDFDEFNMDFIPLLEKIKSEKNVNLCNQFFSRFKKLKNSKNEPDFLFMLG